MRWHRAILTLAALALTSAIYIARQHPATGYELSVYTATPFGFWIGCGVALFVGVAYGVANTPEQNYRSVALFLGSLTTFAIAAIPRIRGYYYYGTWDGATQWGLVKSVLANTPWDQSVLYPMMHLLASALGLVIRFPPRSALFLTLFAGVGLFLVFSPFLARMISCRSRAVAFTVISSWLLLPLMSVRLPTIFPIPNTVAAFAFPLVLVATLGYTRQRNFAWFCLFAIICLFSILLHPMLGLSVSTVAVAFWIVGDGFRITIGRPLFQSQVRLVPVFMGCVFIAWLLRFEARHATLAGSLYEKVSGMGGDVSAAGDSLARIGISLPELFVRVMGPNIVYLILMTALTIVLLYRWVEPDQREFSNHDATQLALSLSLVPLGILILMFFMLGISNLWSRILGITMAVITILGAIALARFTMSAYTNGRRSRASQALIVVVFAVLLVSSLAAAHPSPNIVRPNQHMPEAQMAGYAHVFETHADGEYVTSSYTRPHHFRNAYYGTVEASSGINTAPSWHVVDYDRPPDGFQEVLSTSAAEWDLLVVTETARQTHLDLYQEEVQTTADYRALDQYENNIYQNGDMTIYRPPE